LLNHIDSDFFKLPLPRAIGHRGSAGTHPENTLESFRAAAATGAPYVEFDVHMTRDGEIVVAHDDHLARMCGIERTIPEMTHAEVAELLGCSRRQVGYLPQDPTIYNDLRIIDNVRYFAALYGTGTQAADAAVDAVGLRDHRTALCGNLSGGQRTRVSLACALVCHPDLLVLDEPTVGLDPVLRVDLWEQFHALARQGTTLIVSSHVMDEADHCGDLLLMREGHLLAHTTPAKLREDTGCTSLEEAFLSIIRHSTATAAG